MRFVGLCGLVEEVMFGPLAKSCLKSCGVPCGAFGKFLVESFVRSVVESYVKSKSLV